MIHQATHEAARRCYSFDRAVYDRAARKRQAVGIGIGMGLGQLPQIGGSTGPINFTSFFTSANILQAVQSDVGVTTVSGGVSAWTGTGPGYSQATAGNRPTLGTGANGFPSVVCSVSSGACMSSALGLPAPATTPTFVWWVGKLNSFPNNSTFVGDYTNVISGSVSMLVAGSSVYQYSAAPGNANTTSSYSGFDVTEAWFSNSAADYHKRGTTVSGPSNSVGSTGFGAGTQRWIGVGTGAQCDSEFLALIYLSALPSSTQLTNARAGVLAKYGF